ncbi:MAG: GSCFA domain-containing protein [Bacteroidetes bacterium MedPE-SWsnd-G2]|nr:MAG: GSCFA domain-containing protein [Bacteroidetes bacterium MedPE-SWsnd-G2]
MNFRTQVPVEKQKHDTIDYNSKVLLLGSCFAEHIGGKFNYFKFDTVLNPFGILFHPKAIENLVTDAVNERVFGADDVFFVNEQWHSFDAHSKLSHSDKTVLIDTLNSNVKATKSNLENCSHVIITLGTAWVYRFIEDDRIVANCHKVPQKKFLKQLLSISEIRLALESIMALIHDLNPNAKFVFTVSPVRHLKDGVIENTRSKSHLLSAIHEVVDSNLSASYFPSYEIVMDELRDYRFYAEDMVHPSNLAIDFIWKQFCDSWFGSDTFTIMKDVELIQKGLAHKPFNSESEAHLKFLNTLQEKMAALVLKLPKIRF